MGIRDDEDSVRAIVAIQQLAVSYAFGVDSRDLDLVASLFVDEIDRGPEGVGRDALRASLQRSLAQIGATIHVVTNHVVRIVDADHATGVVYHRGERHELDGTWSTRMGAYEDEYERRGGEWLIARRTLRYWYGDDPVPGAPTVRSTNVTGPRAAVPGETLPGVWPSWNRFWADRGDR